MAAKSRGFDLDCHWTVWVQLSNGAAQEIDHIQTIPDFWRFFNNLDVILQRIPARDCSLHLFKSTIRPSPSDPSNIGGGKLSATIDGDDAQKLYLELAMAMVGEEFTQAEYVNGLEVDLKGSSPVLAIWTSSSDSEINSALQRSIVACSDSKPKASASSSSTSAPSLPLRLTFLPHAQTREELQASSVPVKPLGASSSSGTKLRYSRDFLRTFQEHKNCKALPESIKEVNLEAFVAASGRRGSWPKTSDPASVKRIVPVNFSSNLFKQLVSDHQQEGDKPNPEKQKSKASPTKSKAITPRKAPRKSAPPLPQLKEEPSKGHLQALQTHFEVAPSKLDLFSLRESKGPLKPGEGKAKFPLSRLKANSRDTRRAPSRAYTENNASDFTNFSSFSKFLSASRKGQPQRRNSAPAIAPVTVIRPIEPPQPESTSAIQDLALPQRSGFPMSPDRDTDTDTEDPTSSPDKAKRKTKTKTKLKASLRSRPPTKSESQTLSPATASLHSKQAQDMTVVDVRRIFQSYLDYYSVDLMRSSDLAPKTLRALMTEGCFKCLRLDLHLIHQNRNDFFALEKDKELKGSESKKFTGHRDRGPYVVLRCKMLRCFHLVHLSCTINGLSMGALSPSLQIFHYTSFFKNLLTYRKTPIPRDPPGTRRSCALELVLTHIVSNAQVLRIPWPYTISTLIDARRNKEYLLLTLATAQEIQKSHSQKGGGFIVPESTASAHTPIPEMVASMQSVAPNLSNPSSRAGSPPPLSRPSRALSASAADLTRNVPRHFLPLAPIVPGAPPPSAAYASFNVIRGRLIFHCTDRTTMQTWQHSCNYDLSDLVPELTADMDDDAESADEDEGSDGEGETDSSSSDTVVTVGKSRKTLKLVHVDPQSHNILTLGVQRLDDMPRTSWAPVFCIAYIKYEFRPMSPPSHLSMITIPFSSNQPTSPHPAGAGGPGPTSSPIRARVSSVDSGIPDSPMVPSDMGKPESIPALPAVPIEGPPVAMEHPVHSRSTQLSFTSQPVQSMLTPGPVFRPSQQPPPSLPVQSQQVIPSHDQPRQMLPSPQTHFYSRVFPTFQPGVISPMIPNQVLSPGTGPIGIPPGGQAQPVPVSKRPSWSPPGREIKSGPISSSTFSPSPSPLLNVSGGLPSNLVPLHVGTPLALNNQSGPPLAHMPIGMGMPSAPGSGSSPPLPVLTKEQVIGRVVQLAKSHSGSRFVQQKLEQRDSVFFEIFFNEMKEAVPELMVDNFGHFAIEKLIAMCNAEQNLLLLKKLAQAPAQTGVTSSPTASPALAPAPAPDETQPAPGPEGTGDQSPGTASNAAVTVSCQKHGSFSVQALIDNIYASSQGSATMEQRQVFVLVEALRKDIVRVITHASGHFVVLRMLQKFPYQATKFIDDAILANCLQIGTDHHGLRVVKAVVACRRPADLTRLFKQISRITMKLVENQYGNYVVQSVLDVCSHAVATNVKMKMEGKYMRLSKQKFSSNVIEKCLKQSGTHWRSIIINELCEQPGVSELLRDRYGNYVLQTALSVASGAQVQQIMHAITPHLPTLRENIRSKWKKMLKKAAARA